MSDYLKTWPEKIYVGEKCPVPFGWDYRERTSDIEYIRADIAKEREAKLLSVLKDARSTIDDYAPHAGEYLMKKYRLEETLKEYDNIIAEFEEL